MWLLVSALVVLVVVLAVLLLGARREVLRLRTALDAVTDVGLTSLDPDAVDVVAIHIRNHDEIAAGRSALARPLAVLSPGLVRTLVHREVVRRMRLQLEDEGVVADVRVRRVVTRSRTVPPPE